MKRLIVFLLFLALISLGCGFSTGGPSDADIQATVSAGLAQTRAVLPQPTRTPVVKKPVKTARPTDMPTDIPVSGTESATCTPPNLNPQPGGFVSKVTMAKGTTGAKKDPADPSQVFAQNDAIHAVVAIKGVKNMTFKAVWYMDEFLNKNGDPLCIIQLVETSGDNISGTGNLDFSMNTKGSTLPAGPYRVEVYVDGTLDTITKFSVQ